ncbi:hypothetical protein [Kiloniella sp.]|uniref:hypothetical protein n=1 Tax=Kiloniella sp. TaxID=1938587 RepID=UPI003A8DCAAC
MLGILKKMYLPLIMGGVLWSGPVLAECQKPSYDPPKCTKQYIEIQFLDAKDFEKCKREVTYFLESLDIWSKCIENEARLKGDEAIKLFNCKVNGTANCLETSG